MAPTLSDTLANMCLRLSGGGQLFQITDQHRQSLLNTAGQPKCRRRHMSCGTPRRITQSTVVCRLTWLPRCWGLRDWKRPRSIRSRASTICRSPSSGWSHKVSPWKYRAAASQCRRRTGTQKKNRAGRRAGIVGRRPADVGSAGGCGMED